MLSDPAPSELASGEPGAHNSLRLASWNCNQNLVGRMEMITKRLNKLAIDVLLLQDVGKITATALYEINGALGENYVCVDKTY
jgi:hypothetical protein